MGTNQDYKNRALADLEGNWGKGAIATLIVALITGGISDVVSMPFSSAPATSMGIQGLWTLISLPMGWGLSVFFLNIIRKEDTRYARLFDGFKDYIRVFLAEFLMCIAIAIGFCLLIIPGIMLAIGLTMTDFILKDDKEISAVDALFKSWKMTKGHKMRLFWLALSFIGWAILSLLTLGIGFLFLVPYYEATFAHYYEDLKDNAL